MSPKRKHHYHHHRLASPSLQKGTEIVSLEIGVVVVVVVMDPTWEAHTETPNSRAVLRIPIVWILSWEMPWKTTTMTMTTTNMSSPHQKR